MSIIFEFLASYKLLCDKIGTWYRNNGKIILLKILIYLLYFILACGSVAFVGTGSILTSIYNNPVFLIVFIICMLIFIVLQLFFIGVVKGEIKFVLLVKNNKNDNNSKRYFSNIIADWYIKEGKILLLKVSIFIAYLLLFCGSLCSIISIIIFTISSNNLPFLLLFLLLPVYIFIQIVIIGVLKGEVRITLLLFGDKNKDLLYSRKLISNTFADWYYHLGKKTFLDVLIVILYVLLILYFIFTIVCCFNNITIGIFMIALGVPLIFLLINLLCGCLEGEKRIFKYIIIQSAKKTHARNDELSRDN